MLIALLQAIASGLAVGGAYALIALGFSITFTTTKTLNFSHGDFVSVGSFIGVTVLWLLLGKPINAPLVGVTLSVWQQLLAAVVTVVVIGLIGVLLYFLAVRPFAGKPGMSWVMSTIGFGIILTSIGLAVWGPSQIVVPSPVGDDVIRIAGVGIRPQEILMFVVAIVIMVALDWVMQQDHDRQGDARRRARPTGRKSDGNQRYRSHGRRIFSELGARGSQRLPHRADRVGLAVCRTCDRAEGIFGSDHRRTVQPARMRARRVRPRVLESLVNLWQAQWREIVVFLLVILVLAVRPHGLLGQHTVEKV